MAKARKTKYVYFFGGKRAEGKADMKNLLGGKGANLAEMVNIGLPVPVLQLLPKYVLIITTTKRNIRKNLRIKFLKHLLKLKKKWALNSETKKTRYWFQFVPVLVLQCPA
jgi:pyruvate,orthophosphate dikinase